jgi:hypothetical protein
MGDIPPKLSPADIGLGGRASFLPGCFIRAAPPLLHDLLRQAIGQETTAETSRPPIDGQIDHGVLASVTLAMVNQLQSRYGLVRRGIHRGTVAQTAEKPRLLGRDLAPGFKAQIASISDDESARPEVGDHRCRTALRGGPPIRHDSLVKPGLQARIEHSDFHGGAACTAPGSLKGVGQFGVEAPLRALFENHPAKRRQQPGGKLGLRGFELLAPRQLQDCRQIRYRL